MKTGGALPRNPELTSMEQIAYMTEPHQEIPFGKEEGLDISLYSNPEYNWLQI